LAPKKKPHYALKTINFKLKSKQINSVVDNIKKKEKILEAVENHFGTMKVLKSKLRLKEFIKRKRTEIVEEHLN